MRTGEFLCLRGSDNPALPGPCVGGNAGITGLGEQLSELFGAIDAHAGDFLRPEFVTGS